MSKFNFENGLLSVITEGKTYQIGEQGINILGSTEPLKGDALNGAYKHLSDAVFKFAENENHGKDLPDQLQKIKNALKFKFLSSPDVKELESANSLIKASEQILDKEADTAKKIVQLTKLYANEPKAFNLITASQHNEIFSEASAISFDHVKENAKRVANGLTELKAVFEKGALKKEALTPIFERHGHDLMGFLSDSDRTKFFDSNVTKNPLKESVATGAAKEVEGAFDKVKTAAQELVDKAVALQKNHGTKEGSSELATAALKELEALKAEKPNHGRAIKEAIKTLGEEEAKIFGKIDKSKEFIASVEKAAEGGAKKGGGFFGFFKHSEESLADLSKSKGKTLTEIGKKVGDVRWGRAAMVGLPIAAIGAYFLAGTGNKPGRHTEAAMAQQGAEPAMGR